MSTHSKLPGAPRLIGERRLLGICLVVAVYAIQCFAFMALWIRAQHSPLGILIVPLILIPGWLASGLILGALVIRRGDGVRHFLIGLIVALFATICLVAAGLNHLNNLAPTYHGP